MFWRGVAGLALALLVGAAVIAAETRGTITKVSKDEITVRAGGFFGKDAEEKKFKISKDTKITRAGRDKDAEGVKLTLDELKTAVKVTNVFVTVVHEEDDDKATEIKTGGGLGFGKGKGKFKGKKKKDDDE